MDELHILGVAANYLDTAHYYDVNDASDDAMAKAMVDATIVDWK